MYHLLLVDDEVLIADGMYDALCMENLENLQPMKAYSVQEALQIAESKRIDILLTDINMPDMDGFVLYERMQKLWPCCRVIFLTGFQIFDYAYKAIQYRNVRYIIKAEGVDKVLNVVADVMAELDEEMERLCDVIFEVSEEKQSDSVNLVIDKVERLVEEKLEKAVSLTEIAEELCFNSYYLSRMFKSKKGIGLSDYIAERKMERAKQLLELTDIKVQNIGEKMGYSSPANFIRSFKKYCGMTPNEYRRSFLCNPDKE